MGHRVLHVVPAIASRYGGPSAATLGMCRALDAAGEQTLIVTTDADGPGRLPRELGAISRVDDVRVLMFARRASESFKWSPPLAAWVRQHARDFDIVHIHAVFSHSSLAAGKACREVGVPYIVRPLGTLDPWSLARHAWRKKLLMAVAVRPLLIGAAAMHYTAAEEQRLVEAQLPFVAPGVVVPLAVADDVFANRGQQVAGKPPMVLAMARLDPKKGIDILIDAFHATAIGPFAHWTLTIAGDGEPAYVEGLRRRATAGAAGDRITFAGWADEAGRRQMLQSASVFVLPSQQENFGIAVVEALASAVPVIVSPGVNLARDIERAAAGWVSERTTAAVGETLRLVMSHPEERARRGTAASRFAEQFKWAAVARELTAMYDRVISRCAA